jgi:hypothetical protein
MKALHLTLFAAACTFLGAHALGQGLYFEITTSSGGTEKSWYMPGKFKSIDSDGKGVIVLIDKDTFIHLDPDNKSYTEMTFADMKKMSEASKGMLGAMMKKRLESMTPEQRKMAEEKMASLNQGSRNDVKYEVSNSKETKTINGYSSTKYVVKRNGEEYETIWATNALGSLDAVHKDMEKLSEKMASAFNMKSAPLSWFKEIPGFPVETDHKGDVSTISHVEKRSVSDSEFEVPEGYSKQEQKMPGDMGE